jgi:DinB family protein
MHTFWDQATADLTTEQMNYHERAGVLPITFSLLHYVIGEDRNVSQYLLDAPTLWESSEWEERIGGNLPSVRRGTPVDVAETAQLGSADEWMAYQRGVFSRTESALASAKSEDYDRVIHEDIPEPMKGSFVAFVSAPEGPVYLGDAIDGFVFQHGIRHLGEIEHARSLLGLQGVS